MPKLKINVDKFKNMILERMKFVESRYKIDIMQVVNDAHAYFFNVMFQEKNDSFYKWVLNRGKIIDVKTPTRDELDSIIRNQIEYEKPSYGVIYQFTKKPFKYPIDKFYKYLEELEYLNTLHTSLKIHNGKYIFVSYNFLVEHHLI